MSQEWLTENNDVEYNALGSDGERCLCECHYPKSKTLPNLVTDAEIEELKKHWKEPFQR